MRRLSRSLLLHVVVLMLFIEEAHQCSDVEPQESINGWMLQQHIYRTMMADIGLECLYECHKDDRCQSFNYVFSPRMCEFSNRTKEARPEDFVPDPDRYYFQRDKRRVALGSIPELAAESCKEIKASEKDPVSGKYWLSTIKPGMAVLAHCDKKTGDVDECTASSPVCDVNAICNNTLGSYLCTCKPGFYGDGRTCSDVDECTASSPVCNVNAICNNTLGSYRCTCRLGFYGDGKTCTVSVYKSCAEVYKVGGSNTSGVYKIDPDGSGEFEVFCDQETAGGGWTVFQRRQDGSVDFYRGWGDYKRGFGNLDGEFWLGLDKIDQLTAGGSNKLRVDLEDFNNSTAFAEYSFILVANEEAKYQLTLGSYAGTAGDSMSYHSGSNFTTKDRDNDQYGDNCALRDKGGFWYKYCQYANLNGIYKPGKSSWDGVTWYHWGNSYYSLKKTEMKLRPNSF